MKMLFSSAKSHADKQTGINVEVADIRFLPAHMHAHALEFIYCLEGTLDISLAHQRGKLRAGELLTCDKDDIHVISSEMPNMTLMIHLDLNHLAPAQSLSDFVFISCATLYETNLNRQALETVYDLLLAIAYQVYTGNKDGIVLQRLRDHLVQLLVSQFSWFSLTDYTPEENQKYRERLEKILSYVWNHYQEKITLTRVAEEIHIDANYLSQFLRRSSFESFSFMVKYVRCYIAEKLLLQTDLHVQEISEKCGFSSPSYFYSAFRKIWKTTPLQHRIYYRNLPREEDVRHFAAEDIICVLRDLLISRFTNELLPYGNTM